MSRLSSARAVGIAVSATVTELPTAGGPGTTPAGVPSGGTTTTPGVPAAPPGTKEDNSGGEDSDAQDTGYDVAGDRSDDDAYDFGPSRDSDADAQFCPDSSSDQHDGYEERD